MADPVRPATRTAILAGGRATRLGGSKATAELGGRPLISYPLEAARAAGLRPFVVAKGATRLPALEFEVVLEPDEPTHPLLGILIALDAATGPLVVLGCDMPFVTAGLLGALAERGPPTVARPSVGLEPLLAIYGPGDAETLAAALHEQAPLREAAARLGPATIDEDELREFGDPAALTMSVNTPEDLAAAEELLSG